jgi:hypothetical protein
MKHNLFNGPEQLLDVIKKITEKKENVKEYGIPNVKEDDMPGDEVLYKAAKDSGRKNPGESGDDGVSERCWDGYKPTPGVKAYEKGSCQKEDEESIDEDLQEEVIHEGKKVTLNKPFRTPDGPKKFAVYVRNDKNNVVKVTFGDPNMEIKRDDPERRKSYRARHNCSNPGPKWKANYWSCKMWGSTPVSKMTESQKSPLQVPTGDGDYYHKEKIRRQMAGDAELGESPDELTLKNVNKMKKNISDKSVEESPNFGKEIHQDNLEKHNSSDKQLPKELDDYNSEMMGKDKKQHVKENYASPEPNSAVGKRRDEELPKNVDVIVDSSIYGAGYRVLISFPNKRPLIFPETGEKSASSMAELVASIPTQYVAYCVDKIEFAFKNAKQHNPKFEGGKTAENNTPSVVKGEKS